MTESAHPPHQPPARLYLLQAVGILAWGLVAWSLWQLPGTRLPSVLLCALFLAGFLVGSYPGLFPRHDHRLRLAGLGLQGLAALALLPLGDNGLVSILAIIAVSQMPWFFSLRACVVTVVAYFLLHYLAARLYWQSSDPLVTSLIYLSFMLFALFATHGAAREQEGREALSLLNSELKATQHLLADSAAQGERLRIARDLHDTLGHHLTALSIQLEIASRLSEGEARAQVDKARQLAKLLLADVRETVSELREEGGIDLGAALRALVADAPRLAIHLELPEALSLDDAQAAETLLRAAQEIITNALRHGDASRLDLILERQGAELVLKASDNGRGAKGGEFREGNGLRGLRERLGALGGSLAIDGTDGFRLRLNLPERRA
ncbi:MAG: sensor histidine kinase [Gammaproteobacteria bacterium]|nr:sensor histidine kinase [Gammaproteobacteria bacterium]